MTSRPPPRAFYQTDAVTLARALIGCRLVHRSQQGTTAGIVVETEAYAGHTDAACHSYRRAAPSGAHRTNVMFGPGGYAYVYLIYGMYNCFNVVANAQNEPEAVLIRALEPHDGLGLMRTRRNTDDARKLCSGPGKLCSAMGITREHYGLDLCGDTLYLERGNPLPDDDIAATPRINVDYAGEHSLLPYRFVLRNSPHLSTRRFLPKDKSKGRGRCPHPPRG